MMAWIDQTTQVVPVVKLKKQGTTFQCFHAKRHLQTKTHQICHTRHFKTRLFSVSLSLKVSVTIETNSRPVFLHDLATTLASLQHVQITETTAPLIKTFSDLLLSQQHFLD